MEWLRMRRKQPQSLKHCGQLRDWTELRIERMRCLQELLCCTVLSRDSQLVCDASDDVSCTVLSWSGGGSSRTQQPLRVFLETSLGRGRERVQRQRLDNAFQQHRPLHLGRMAE